MKLYGLFTGMLLVLILVLIACTGASPTSNFEPTPTPTPTPISEARAIEIAREAGLEPGVEPWTANYFRHAGNQSYVWSVTNTLGQSSDLGGVPGVVVLGVVIDATTGDVIWRNVVMVTPEDEGILLIKRTPEYKSLVNKYGSDNMSVKAVNLDDDDEADYLRKISDGFLMEPGCIILLRAGKGEGYVYRLDEEFHIVFRMTLSEFEQGARNVDARTMEHFYRSLK